MAVDEWYRAISLLLSLVVGWLFTREHDKAEHTPRLMSNILSNYPNNTRNEGCAAPPSVVCTSAWEEQTERCFLAIYPPHPPVYRDYSLTGSGLEPHGCRQARKVTVCCVRSCLYMYTKIRFSLTFSGCWHFSRRFLQIYRYVTSRVTICSHPHPPAPTPASCPSQ